MLRAFRCALAAPAGLDLTELRATSLAALADGLVRSGLCRRLTNAPDTSQLAHDRRAARGAEFARHRVSRISFGVQLPQPLSLFICPEIAGHLLFHLRRDRHDFSRHQIDGDFSGAARRVRQCDAQLGYGLADGRLDHLLAGAPFGLQLCYQ